MDFVQLAVLAFVQGLTEFLPISSTAHLILAPTVFGWPDQGLAFDVAVHMGSLVAVLSYFRKDIGRLLSAWLLSLQERRLTPDARLVWAVGFGTIPVGLAGLLFGDLVGSVLRSPIVIAGATIGFGLLLWAADTWSKRLRDERTLNWRDVLVVGVMQALALIPGTSRSGITMTAGLLMGLTREAAARFSFLLAIPVILLSGGKTILELSQETQTVDWLTLLFGAILSALSAYLCIHYFLKFIQKIGMLPFVIYRLILGVLLLVVLN